MYCPDRALKLLGPNHSGRPPGWCCPAVPRVPSVPLARGVNE